MDTIQKQVDQLDAIRGKVASHYELANEVEALGFRVDIDSDDNELSRIYLLGACGPNGEDLQVGEIRGDSEATII